jgi:restriction system protein
VQRQQAEVIKEISLRAAKLRREELARLTRLRGHKIDFLLGLAPYEFEGMIAKMYRQMGFAVSQTPASNDFGRDLVLTKDGTTIFVECKRYGRDKLIGRPALQKFYAAIMTMKADSGVVVTTSDFAATAIKFASENGIKLINGDELSAMMARAFPDGGDADLYKAMCGQCGGLVTFDMRINASEVRCQRGHVVICDLVANSLTFKALADVPSCDTCGGEMRLVNGRRGKFWGCRKYPKCRGTKPCAER